MEREAPIPDSAGSRPPNEPLQPEDEPEAETAGLVRERIGWHGITFRALRHRNYRLFFGGQLVSLIGSWMQTTALMWLAYQLSGESRWPAWVAAAQMLPAFLLGAWGGLLVERLPRRALILGTQSALLVQALLLAGMVWSGLATPLTLLGVAVVIGCINAVDLPARLSFVVEMVDREDLPNAVALNSMLFNVARAVGPLLSGSLLRWIDPGFCFLINGLSFLAVLLALACMNVPRRSSGRGKHSGLRAILAAFQDLADDPALAILLGLVAAVCVFGWPSQSLLPALAREGLQVSEGERGYSLLLCGAGTGAVAAALVLASFSAARHRQGFLCAGIGLASVGLVGLAVAPNLPLALASNAMVGFGLILFMATSQSVVQLNVHDRNRGRILGIWSMVINGAVPMGNLLAGPAADRWSVPLVLTIQGVGCLAALLVALLFLRLRRASEMATAE